MANICEGSNTKLAKKEILGKKKRELKKNTEQCKTQ